jgi:ribosome-associated translation inhibitor RaiA
MFPAVRLSRCNKQISTGRNFVNELDFTIEFNSDLDDTSFEEELFLEADSRLQTLAKGHSDITGAAVTVRRPAVAETPPLHEATVVAYVRPNNMVGKEKQESAVGALKAALDAVERQIREKRDKLKESWKQPQSDPVAQELLNVEVSESVDIQKNVDES